MSVNQYGYRPNVGIIVQNKSGQLLWAKRKGQNSWQFPQGGIDEGENEKTAMFRELYEEIGLTQKDVSVIYISKHWFNYKLPKQYLKNQRPRSGSNFIGQTQKWFLLRLESEDSAINLNAMSKPEFDDWRWVSFWYPLRYIITFKKEVYRKVLKEFTKIAN